MPFLSYALAAHAEAPALDDGLKTWSYRDLGRSAETVARRLRTLGVAPGETVAVRGSGPGPEMVVALHGVWMAGGAVTVLHPGWTNEEEARALRLLEPRVLLLLGDEDPDRASRASGPREVRTLGDLRPGPVPPLEAVDPALDPLPPAFDRPGKESEIGKRRAATLLTSGTTGVPKVVSLTVGNLVASSRGAAKRLGLRREDRWLASLSPAHVGGLALITRSALVGSTLVVRGPFGLSGFLHLLSSGAITHASLVPTMLHRLVEASAGPRAPRSLQCLLIGGAQAPASLLDESLVKGFPLALSYGLTEASSQVATAPPSLVRRKPGTVGTALPGVTVRVASGGEVQVQGPTVAPGQARGDGWLRTGDLGEQDRDGHLWITGRLSDRIVTGGVNVDPLEVETVLRGHPGVENAVVVGIPDREWGQRVVAAVEVSRDFAPSRDGLDRLVRSALSPPKRPRSFLVVEALPLNSNGKVDRDQVRRLFR